MKVWITTDHPLIQMGPRHRVFATLEAAKAAFPDAEWVEERLNRPGAWMGRHPRTVEGPVLIEPHELEGTPVDWDDHFVTFDQEGWLVEHSLACRLAGTMGTCEYTKAIRGIASLTDEDDYGRWHIDEIDSEGMPGLVRA